MIKLYGIANCDSIKKARKWLKDNGLEYEFHDYKKLGVPEEELRSWVKNKGWEILLNKRGTTWRKLDEKSRLSVNEISAIQIMQNNPSIIKRPVLSHSKILLIGFSIDEYTRLL